MHKGLAAAFLLLLGIAAAAYFAIDGPAFAPGASGTARAPGSPASQSAPAAARAVSGDLAAPAAERDARQEIPLDSEARAVRHAVTGRLIGRAGLPREGVEVELHAFDTAGSLPLLESSVFSRAGGKAPRAVSGADGRFSFLVEKGREGMLSVPDEDLVFGEGRTRFGPLASDLDLGDIEVLAAAVVGGIVRDASGRPVADVKVMAQESVFAFGEHGFAKTDAEGRFRLGKLKPGEHVLRTASARFLPTVRRISLAEEEQKLDLVLEVLPGQAVSGRVVDDLGRPVAGIKVGARRVEERPGLQMERFTPDEATETDAGGWFLLSGLSGTKATIRAWGKGHAGALAADVPVGTGDLVLRVQRLASIEGVLLDDGGRPVAGSVVRAFTSGGGAASLLDDMDLPLAGAQGRATTGEDGGFRLEGVSPGDVTLTALGQGHRPLSQPGFVLAPGQHLTGARLIVTRGASARVSVVDSEGRPVSGALVRAEKPPVEGPAGTFARRLAVGAGDGAIHVSDGREDLGRERTGSGGVAVIGGLPPGPVRFSATHPEFADSLPVTRILPASGTAEVALALRRPGYAAISIEGPEGPCPEAGFAVHGPIGGPDEADRRGAADANGRSRFGPLPAGEYYAEVELSPIGRSLGGGSFVVGSERRGIEQSRVSFSIIEGQDTEVLLRKPVLARVHGTVRGAGGPAAGVLVELLRAGSDPSGGLPGLFGPSARTGKEGEYSIEDVEAGEYEISFGKAEQLVRARQPLRVPAGAADVRADLMLSYGKLRVAAFAPDAPGGIAGAEVELVPVRPEENGPGGQRPRRVMMVSMTISSDGEGPAATTMTMGKSKARTDGSGAAEIDLVPPGRYMLRITDGGHAEVESGPHEVFEAQITDCGRVEMQPAGHIRGSVVTAGGQPPEFAIVSCRRAGSDGEPRRQPAMGGKFAFDGLAPGLYLLSARGIAGSNFGPEVEVDVPAGKRPVTAEVRLPPE
ncbi:MAG: hypothetical protein Fur0037_01830 [Planctomycetota bacterium]